MAILRDLRDRPPIEDMAVRAGVEIVRGEGMSRGEYLVVGDRVLIFVPDWVGGAAARESMIARQAILMAVEALGAERALGLFAAALGLLRLRWRFGGRSSRG